MHHLSPDVAETATSAAAAAANEPTPSAVAAKRKKKKKKKKGNETVVYVGPQDGAKKDTTVAMPDAYHPRYVEAAWQDWWEASGIFSTSSSASSASMLANRRNECDGVEARSSQSNHNRFSVVLPPPNVTGNLHIGHALTVSVQDALCRWRRMCGDEVTWVPGFDHAGIATQSVVEKKLWAEEGKTRDDLGRDEFVKRVSDWKDLKGWFFSLSY